ncbi:2-oxoglutarate synthase subunit KorA [Thermoplasmatales archaeon]|nr:2-oxoglutarate synthase subunit KorA [Thermoplasmatales archaeon]
MSNIDLNLSIGGPQGGGIDTSSNLISRAFASSGYNVLGVREFHSNIKGRHSYVHLRIREERPRSLKYPLDFLVALDPDTIFEHLDDVSTGTIVLYDTNDENAELAQARMIMRDTAKRINGVLQENKLDLNVKGALALMKKNGAKIMGIPFSKVLEGVELDGPATRYYNVLGASLTLSIIGLDQKFTRDSLKHIFGNKEKVIALNVKVVDAAYKYCRDNGLQGKTLPDMDAPPRMLLTGNDGAALGKIMGGLRFQTYYPITPASDESSILEEHEDIKWLSNENKKLASGGITVVQTEDELSAITMAEGAAITGARSATATSGPGFSLMAEAISFAGIDEIPVVITFYQRGGPSTGLPTRNGQGDLMFAMNTGHGEFPKMVISSGDVEECIYDSMKALNYAQRYQLPVIHLIDKNLANTSDFVPVIETKKIKVEQSLKTKDKSDFKRYTLDTKNGVSPMGVFGKDIFWMTGDEHDELGHVTEDPLIRDRMMEKRFTKLKVADDEIPDEDKAQVFGSDHAKVTFITWGSQKGVILDAIDGLKAKGIEANMLYLKMFEPFPSKFVDKILKKAGTVIDVESNMTGQAAKVIRMNTGFEVTNFILKYNGRHITEDELISATSDIVSKKKKIVVLENGA